MSRIESTFTITKRGRELARCFLPWLGYSDYIAGVCSAIARLATTYHRLQEIQCNREVTARELAQEARIERRIRDLVNMLPHTDDGPITVRFGGDPRGYCVKLHVPNAPHEGNTWGRDGDFGV